MASRSQQISRRAAVRAASVLLLVATIGGIAVAADYHDTKAPTTATDASPPIVHDEPLDEAKAGRTMRGTRIHERGVDSFPAEPRDLLWRMDQVAGPDGTLQPLDFDENCDGRIDDKERDAIRGRNTWLLWGGGNEAFWGWLQEQGYGLIDFLILLDSRERGRRFATAGLINQPGLETSPEPFLGLYLDRAKGDSALLTPPQPRQTRTGCIPEDGDGARDEPPSGEPQSDGATNYATADARARERWDAHGRQVEPPVERPVAAGNSSIFFEPWTTIEEFRRTHENPEKDPLWNYIPEVARARLPQDGFDPAVYGYPSGIFGLRLMLNPDFFAADKDAAKARAYWRERVELTNGRYYTDPAINADPKLIRPFRVSMSCGYCHIGPHPLNPPKDNENPEWENLSGIIGGQYWDPQPAFGNLLRRPHFLHHFLKSQAPGTIDTSLVSTDHINNTNVINAIFDVPARLQRAQNKPTERQSLANLDLPTVEDPDPKNPDRHFPMVLFPGEDSVGVFGALARVYLNIGVYSEMWARADNPIIGFTPQRPFSVAVSQKNSVYWNVNQTYRVPYLGAFFQLGTQKHVPKSTAPMKLVHARSENGAPIGRTVLEGDDEVAREQNRALRRQGRTVFIDHCAICHSSKQPDGFDLAFPSGSIDWPNKQPPREPNPVTPDDPHWLRYELPSSYRLWDAFKGSPAYRDYVARLRAMPEVANAPDGSVDAKDAFLEHNFLSNELRIPVTLVGTYSGRAMATNAMRGQVWDNFSSDTFKSLPSVGDIEYFDPFAKVLDPKAPDPDRLYGTNAKYNDGRERGGPGYFRPASLISLWATAPYFHNNALGIYNHDPKVEGRLAAFEDGIEKLLTNAKRAGGSGLPGDLRSEGSSASANDPGYIYRLPVDTHLTFAPGFVRPLIEGVLVGNFGARTARIVLGVLSCWLWVALITVFLLAAWRGRTRHVGVIVLALAVLVAVLLAVTGAGGYGGTMTGALMMMGATALLYCPPLWAWTLVVVLGFVGFWLLQTRWDARWLPRLVFGVLAAGSLFVGVYVHEFLAGKRGGLDVGPIPRGTPVNLLMSIDPEKTDVLPEALIALLRATLQIKKDGLTREDAWAVLAKTAGPALLRASKSPDFVLDRGHWFGENLSPDDKRALIAFLKTL